MNNYDVVVVGAGLTGSALSYELAKQKFKVLLVEKNLNFDNATAYSYGGIAHWCGTNDFTNKLCEEGLNIHRNLTAELGSETEFREIDLLFTIPAPSTPTEVAKNYQHFRLTPELLDIKNSCELEPLLNPESISGCLRLPHGHVNPLKTILAYQNAYKQLGGEIVEQTFISTVKKEDKITGIITDKNKYSASKIIICAGAHSRQILAEMGIKLPLYFTHAQLIKTKPSHIKLRTLVMPSTTARFLLEKDVTALGKNSLWENPTNELQGEVLEPGAIQFLDGSFCLGQISQIITNISAPVHSTVSEQKIREGVEHYLPLLGLLEGRWYNCQVAFTTGMPFQVKELKEGLAIFSGFTSPFLFVPPLAKRFARDLRQS
ncbi:MAG: FAD-binding oxidoreductase [Cyanobacterium sp. T60_A2020_053]|nr:FAD-binding oxidoreductase [Cyanobacterium sp. T60_A2020_053]